MSKVIDITDKFSDEKPSIKIGDKTYPIDDSMDVVFKFEELSQQGSKGALDAIKLVVGEKAYKEIKVEKMSVANFKTIMIALLAGMQGITYEDAESRFRLKGL